MPFIVKRSRITVVMRMGNQNSVFIQMRVRLAIIGLLALAYVLLVPIVPFQYHYNVDVSNQSAIDTVCVKSLVSFDAFSRPPSITLSDANFGVWGVQSISASLANFGLVSTGVCAFNPSTQQVNGLPILWFFTLPISAAFLIGVAVLLRRNTNPKP